LSFLVFRQGCQQRQIAQAGAATSPHATPQAFPGLTAHYERMMARPAVRKTCEIEAAIGYQLPA
jgi:hypothetical protein